MHKREETLTYVNTFLKVNQKKQYTNIPLISGIIKKYSELHLHGMNLFSFLFHFTVSHETYPRSLTFKFLPDTTDQGYHNSIVTQGSRTKARQMSLNNQ